MRLQVWRWCFAFALVLGCSCCCPALARGRWVTVECWRASSTYWTISCYPCSSHKLLPRPGLKVPQQYPEHKSWKAISKPSVCKCIVWICMFSRRFGYPHDQLGCDVGFQITGLCSQYWRWALRWEKTPCRKRARESINRYITHIKNCVSSGFSFHSKNPSKQLSPWEQSSTDPPWLSQPCCCSGFWVHPFLLAVEVAKVV